MSRTILAESGCLKVSKVSKMSKVRVSDVVDWKRPNYGETLSLDDFTERLRAMRKSKMSKMAKMSECGVASHGRWQRPPRAIGVRRWQRCRTRFRWFGLRAPGSAVCYEARVELARKRLFATDVPASHPVLKAAWKL